MILRLLADGALNVAIVAGTIRRNPTLDFRRADDVPLRGLDDDSVLDLAAWEGRVTVSHDVNTMPEHFREFTGHRGSPGLILVPQRRVVKRSSASSQYARPVTIPICVIGSALPRAS